MYLKGEGQCQVCLFAPTCNRNIFQNFSKILEDKKDPDLSTLYKKKKVFNTGIQEP